MPSQHALSERDCIETLRVYEAAGRRSNESARRLGIAGSTFRNRLKTARGRYPSWSPDAIEASDPAKAGFFTPPKLAPQDEDLDALMDRMAKEQERRKAHRNSADWMRFTVHDAKPFCLAFIGDPHLDTCDIGLLRRHVELIEATDRMWAVCLGDMANQWVGRLRGQYALQSTTERQGFLLVKWLLSKPIWWLILAGNHDGPRWHGGGSPLNFMETAAPVPLQEWQAKFEIKCGPASWRIWAAHNFPGNSIYNSNHGPDKRALHTGAMADLFVAGDRHVFKLSQDQHEHTGRVFWSARAKGYKPLDSYALELGHGEQTIGHSIGAVFDPMSSSLVCFADLFEAARYLKFLNGSAI